ncbi:MAG: galactose mutarotase [Rhizobiales bacterium]|nr:galactose mutarotase [Hyphomicrobiales bacterium]
MSQPFVLEGPGALRVSFIAQGGIVTAIEAPDRDGRRANVVLGLPDPALYRDDRIFLGAVCGRYANRIAGSRFMLDGIAYALTPTQGTSSVHGGGKGFDKADWTVTQDSARSAVLRHVSPDGDEGYPGTLSVAMRYAIDDDGAFSIAYEATTDRPTLCNLTNHSYFNLAGEGSGDVLGHEVRMFARRYTPSDAILVPTGEIAPVAGTPFDFTAPRAIGARIREPHPQMVAGHGYDVNYVIDRDGPGLVPAALVHEPRSGRTLRVETTEPGIQLYTGNGLDGTIAGTGGRLYRQSDGFCLEPHKYPDTPNKPGFPSAVLRPGETYRSLTRYVFGVA